MPIERNRVVRVRTPGGAADRHRFGSGYLIGGGRVLTARHVLVPPDCAPADLPRPGQRCEVSLDGTQWSAATATVIGGDDVDAAILDTSLGGELPPAHWARLAGAEPLNWDAMGYPVAGLAPEGREAEHAWGMVSPLTADGTGWLGLTVSSRPPRVTGTAQTGWAGLSGAAVICDSRIAAVIITDPQAYADSLRALRAEAILADPAIARLLGAARLEQVGGYPATGSRPAPGDPWPGEPVLLIVDDEDTEVIFGQVRDLVDAKRVTNLDDAVEAIANPAVRIDAALVDICIGEPTGESGRTVLAALRQHRPHVPRCVVSADPYMGIAGDITALMPGYGVFRTLRKQGARLPVPGLRECVQAMLRQDDAMIGDMVSDQIDMIREACVRGLKKERAIAIRRKRNGEIDEAELRAAEDRVTQAESAVAAALEEAGAAEGADKWEAVAALRARLGGITAGAR